MRSPQLPLSFLDQSCVYIMEDSTRHAPTAPLSSTVHGSGKRRAWSDDRGTTHQRSRSATHSRIVAWVDYRRVRERVISVHFLHSGLPPVPDLRWCGRMRLPFGQSSWSWYTFLYSAGCSSKSVWYGGTFAIFVNSSLSEVTELACRLDVHQCRYVVEDSPIIAGPFSAAAYSALLHSDFSAAGTGNGLSSRSARKTLL